MERRTFGQTGLLVPTIGMGTWRTSDMRGTATEQHARTIADTALDAGADFFDSSPMYGEAERVLGPRCVSDAARRWWLPKWRYSANSSAKTLSTRF